MTKVVLDKIDRKILQLLVRNARMPFLEIARECGISGAAIHQRVKKLDEQGVILGSKLLVDPRLLGYDVCAFVGVRVQEPSLEGATIKALESIPAAIVAANSATVDTVSGATKTSNRIMNAVSLCLEEAGK